MSMRAAAREKAVVRLPMTLHRERTAIVVHMDHDPGQSTADLQLRRESSVFTSLLLNRPQGNVVLSCDSFLSPAVASSLEQ